MIQEVTDSKSLIEDFIRSRVTGNGLDRRTEKAYRLDLEHFYAWAERRRAGVDASGEKEIMGGENAGRSVDTGKGLKSWEDWMEAYLDYLKREKKLSVSTICRKNRVLGYHLSFLVKQGIISECRPLKKIKGVVKKTQETGEEFGQGFLSKQEADGFFGAMDREYERLDSEFRRRVCLRDMVMMELLFYHKVEISELLRIEVSDYDRETGTLVVRRKRGGDYRIRLFSQELQKKLELWLDERKAFRQEGEYYDRLILSKLGKPLSMEMFIHIFDKYRRLAGIEKKLTPKDLKEGSMKRYAKELVMERCN